MNDNRSPEVQDLSGRIEQARRTFEIHAQVITRELDELKGEVSMIRDKVSRLEQPCPNCSALKNQVEYITGLFTQNNTELADAHDKLAELGCPSNVEGIGLPLADKIQALYNYLKAKTTTPSPEKLKYIAEWYVDNQQMYNLTVPEIAAAHNISPRDLYEVVLEVRKGRIRIDHNG